MLLFYFKFYEFLKTYSQTPNTPAIHLFYALEQTLINILNEGAANRYADLRHKANLLRQGMLDLGLKFLIDQKDMCSVLTTVQIPLHIDIGIVRVKLREKSIIIYEGKGCFKNKVFQVGNIGELSRDDIRFFLKSLSKILESFDRVASTNITFANDRNAMFPHASEHAKDVSEVLIINNE